MKGRRGNNEGSIYRRKQDGRWCSLLTIGYTPEGKRKRRYIYGQTKREVQVKLLELHKEAHSGILVEPGKMLVGEFLELWLEDVARPSIRASTYACYEIVIRVHIKPHVGGVPLKNLQAFVIQNLISKLKKSGKGARTLQLVYIILRKALSQAVKWGQLFKNPCELIDKPKSAKKSMKYWSPEQISHFLKIAKCDEFYALYVLAVTTGLRQGELFGLKWSDFNEKNSSLSIQRTIYEINGNLVENEPKTASSRRKIDLPKIAHEALKQHHAKMTQEKKSSCWVFCDSLGQPLRRSNFRKRSFLKLLKASGLPRIRFHDLRHSAATLLLSKGVHPKVVQERLGHSQISITLDTYSHVLPSLQKDAVNKIDEALEEI